MYVCMYVYAYIHIVYIIKAVFAACRRLEQRHEAPTEREAPEVILRCKAQLAPMEQRREALTEREALEVILGGIYVQCNKRSPLVFIKNK